MTVLLVFCLLQRALALFSVTDDLYSFPQYEVEWSSAYVTPEDERLGHPSSMTMVHSTQRYLCSVPSASSMVHLNSTEVDLMKREEEKELSRAVSKGWQLLSPLEGNCLYFMSGWWTYAYCHGNMVKQFHQLPPKNGLAVYPPAEDPDSESYVLGYSKNQADIGISGEIKFLTHKFSGGTECDLTGHERRIEVQFHCDLHGEKIAWVKEIATCCYQMVVYTPRLCDDLIFVPPTKAANIIECMKVLTEEEQIVERQAVQEEIERQRAQDEEKERTAPRKLQLKAEDDGDERQIKGKENADPNLLVSIEILALNVEKQIAEGKFLTPQGKVADSNDEFSYSVALVGVDDVLVGAVEIVVENGRVRIELPKVPDPAGIVENVPEKGEGVSEETKVVDQDRAAEPDEGKLFDPDDEGEEVYGHDEL